MYLNVLKKELDKTLNNLNEKEIKFLSDTISIYKKSSNNIFVTGIGKSKHFARHMSDILKSLSYKCFFLDGIDSIHGDLGAIHKNDLIIVISRSGNTSELKYPLEVLNKRNVKIYGIFCNKNSMLQTYCNNLVILPSINEMDPGFNMVPSNSLIVYHTFLSLLIRHIFDNDNITLNEYSKNHPAGDIGKRALTVVNDKTKIDILKINISDDVYINSKIYEIMKRLDKNKTGICCFVNNKDELYGILTNGMIIAELSKGNVIIIDNIINKNPIVINNINTRVEDLKLNMKHRYFPVIQNDKLYGVYENCYC
jgi:arabinose-5-phosphate isomerase